MKLSGILLLLGTAASAMADRNAPVLVWESAVSSSPALPALPAMSNSQLQNHLNSLKSKALVMFIMNELSVEDFSGHPSAFQQLREEFESSQNAFTPSMPDPSQLPAHLDAYSRVTVDPEQLGSLKLAAGPHKTLFLVYVGDRAEAERREALEQTDALISKVLTKVKSLTGKYSAVLTGKHTTMGGEAPRRVARSLKAAAEADTDSQFANAGCVFIYTSSPAVMRFTVPDDKGATSTWRLDLGEATVASKCSNESDSLQSQVTLSWTDKTGAYDTHTISLTSINLTLNFRPRLTGDKEASEDTVSSWTLVPASLVYNGTLDTKPISKNETLDFGDVYAPIEFSYHCTNRSWVPLVAPNVTTVPVFSALELPGFQVQAFLPSGAVETFGRAWDCTTFFTIPIWSGLFLSLILLLILVWSLMMLAGVPTMDRFDDPRGQPLHVPNTE